MASSGLRGPYQLTMVGVDGAVATGKIGAYALGQTDYSIFNISYVGRSDDDLNARLKQHVPKWYPQFKFDYFPSAKAAFDKECNLYHDFNPPDNDLHPARPQNSNWKCPRCNNFG